MSTTNCATADVLATTCRPPPQRRWWEEAHAAWTAWRARVHEREALHSLQALGPGTLHDIGLAERVPQRPTLSLADYERGRW